MSSFRSFISPILVHSLHNNGEKFTVYNYKLYINRVGGQEIYFLDNEHLTMTVRKPDVI